MGAGKPTDSAEQGTLAGTPSVVGQAPAMPTLVGDVGASVPPAMPTLSGAQLGAIPTSASAGPSRYQVGDEIARGGMGRVVEAVDTVLGRVVALKEALALEPDAIRRFHRETKITARLEHPSIVPVHDAGILPGGAPYYVMRKISGRPLETIVLTTNRVEDRLALIPHLVAAANAVAHAHVRGIVHRDIKPSNILVGELGETIVIDWGLAKVIGEADEIVADLGAYAKPEDIIKTRVGIVFGTPGFMAPEQLYGQAVDERCDVYALGATLYHMLALKPPHHAKTADAMMKAAVEGPPTPIRELQPGVPPELATIVDKALAVNANDRYQDARALAEDLSRFMTGQLVASHHYTRAQRLQRFVKQHRVPVIAIAAALGVLIVGGALAFHRIVAERDRADAERAIAVTEKQRAVDRADQIALAQARILVATNPTLAIALARPLVDKHWRDVRDIASAARSVGVAWSLAASSETTSIDFSHDGTHLVIAGDDGVVREVDLVSRVAHTIAERHARVEARFVADDRVVIFHDRQLALVDPGANTKRELATAAAIVDLEVAGTIAYWVDADKHVWSLDLAVADAQPVAIASDEAIERLAPSPDGHWLALAGERHLLMLDRQKPTELPIEAAFGHTEDAAWSADGKHLAAEVDDRVIDIVVDPVPLIGQRKLMGKRLGIAFTDKMYSLGALGLAVFTDSEPENRKQLSGSPLGLREARAKTLIAASNSGTLHVVAADGDHVIPVPLPQIQAIDASPRSPYLVAAFAGRLLIWNLDEIQPRAITASVPAFTGFAGSAHLLATYLGAPAHWLDLATHGDTAIDALGPIGTVTASPDGDRAVTIDVAHHAQLLVPGKAVPAVELPGEVARAGFFDSTHVILGGANGLALYDLGSGKAIHLATPGGAFDYFAWSRGAWIAASSGSTLWRHPIAGPDATVELGGKPTSPPIVLADGTVVVGLARQLWAWRADGTLAMLGALPKAVADLAPGDPATSARAIAFDVDGMTYIVELASGQITPSYALGSSAAAMAADGGLVVSIDRTGNLEVVDPLMKQHWILAEAAGATFAFPRISPDGNRIVATTTAHAVLFTLDLPATAAATATWLDRLTNAHAAIDNSLTWP